MVSMECSLLLLAAATVGTAFDPSEAPVILAPPGLVSPIPTSVAVNSDARAVSHRHGELKVAATRADRTIGIRSKARGFKKTLCGDKVMVDTDPSADENKMQCDKTPSNCHTVHLEGHDFPVCAYTKPDIVSDSIRKGKVWEERMMRAFAGALEKNPGAVVLDVGANVGEYSQLAASLGHPVYAFEPTQDSYRLLQTSRCVGAKESHTDNDVTLFYNAVSDKAGTVVQFTTYSGNTGGTAMRKNNATKTEKLRLSDPVYGRDYSCTTTLDNLLSNDDFMMKARGNGVVLKIDVEGFECNVLQGAKNLFGADADIPFHYVQVEWNLEHYKPETCDWREAVRNTVLAPHRQGMTLRAFDDSAAIPGNQDAIETFLSKLTRDKPHDVIWSTADAS